MRLGSDRGGETLRLAHLDGRDIGLDRQPQLVAEDRLDIGPGPTCAGEDLAGRNWLVQVVFVVDAEKGDVLGNAQSAVTDDALQLNGPQVLCRDKSPSGSIHVA